MKFLDKEGKIEWSISKEVDSVMLHISKFRKDAERISEDVIKQDAVSNVFINLTADSKEVNTSNLIKFFGLDMHTSNTNYAAIFPTSQVLSEREINNIKDNVIIALEIHNSVVAAQRSLLTDQVI